VIAAYFDRLFRELRVQHEVCERVEAVDGSVIAVDIGEITNGSAARSYKRLSCEVNSLERNSEPLSLITAPTFHPAAASSQA
jgi:hypothetical protein